MPKTYAIKAAAANPRAAEIFIYGDIGPSWDGESTEAATFVKELAALDADTITVRISSHGGSVVDGLAIYNALKRHHATVHIEIDAIAASIASLIAMAGDTISMADNALMMIHAPWGMSWGNSAELREMADVLDQHAAAMATSYAAGTGLDVQHFLDLLADGKDHWFTAAEAAEAGYIHEITAALPMAASIRNTFDLSRYNSAAQTPAAAAAKHEEPAMPNPNTPAAPTTAAIETPEQITARVRAEEKTRREGVSAAFDLMAKSHGDTLAALRDQCLADMDCTVDRANAKILAKLAEGASPVQGSIVVVEDERDKFKAAASTALLARAGISGFKVDAANPFRGHKLLDLARASLQRAGISTDGMDQMKIVATAFTQSTSDFPILLEEAMHKALQSSYTTMADTWRRFCATGSVSDFRAHNRYRLGSLGNLDALNELGEFKNKAIPDGEKASVSIGTKGNIINLSRQAIINDDMGAFIGLASLLGRAAARSIEADVYALLAEGSGLGPLMDDGKRLFHADHGNIGTGAAISVASIDADRVLMAAQKDISGNDYLDLRPDILLVPTSLGGTARVINSAQYDPDTANKMQRPNMVAGLYGDIVDTPRISGTRRYSFANPTEAAVLEVDFLDGNETPFLEQQDGFDVDGTRYKVRLDYGVTAVDYRGAVTNAGQ